MGPATANANTHHPPRSVHFARNSAVLRTDRVESHPAHQTQSSFECLDEVRTWSSRHAILRKLTPQLIRHYPELWSSYRNRYRSHSLAAGASDDARDVSCHLGFPIECFHRVQGASPHHPPDALHSMLDHVLACQIDPSRDLVPIRTLSQSKSGKVELVKTKLSGSEDLNRANLYVLKTIPKKCAIRMWPYVSIESELIILKLSKAKTDKQDHIPIPKLKLSFQSPESLHFLMEFVCNGNLADYLSSFRHDSSDHDGTTHIPEDLVRFWTGEMVLCLEWLHQTHGYVHRDVKPSNFLIDRSGHLVLNDFGTCTSLSSPFSVHSHHQIVDRHLSQLRNTQVWIPLHRELVSQRACQVLVGTCDYIAPEVLSGHLDRVIKLEDSSNSTGLALNHTNKAESEWGHYGNEVDFWSMGISVYEMVYGLPPFFCQSIPETYEQIISHQEHLNFPTLRARVLDGQETVTVSKELRNFIRLLLSDRDVRLGCGPNGVMDIKRHSWFLGVEWDQLWCQQPPHFEPHSQAPTQAEDRSRLQTSQSGGFNFSKVFNEASSPGLSILRHPPPTNSQLNPTIDDEKNQDHDQGLQKSSHGGRSEENLFWGFTDLAERSDEFDQVQEKAVDDNVKRPSGSRTTEHHLKSSMKSVIGNQAGVVSVLPPAVDPDRFKTPIRPHRHRQEQFSRQHLQQPSRSVVISASCRRTKRFDEGDEHELDPMEELHILTEHLTLTAKKKVKREAIVGTTNHKQLMGSIANCARLRDGRPSGSSPTGLDAKESQEGPISGEGEDVGGSEVDMLVRFHQSMVLDKLEEISGRINKWVDQVHQHL